MQRVSGGLTGSKAESLQWLFVCGELRVQQLLSPRSWKPQNKRDQGHSKVKGLEAPGRRPVSLPPCESVLGLRRQEAEAQR